MSMNLKDFSLLKEDNENYHIGHPKGRSMVIPKRGLSDKAQLLISKLKREQNFAEGTPEGTEEVAPAADVTNSESVQDSPESIVADAAAGAGQQPPSPMTAEAEIGAIPQNSEMGAQKTSMESATGANTSEISPQFSNSGLQNAKSTLQKAGQAEDIAGKEQAKAYGDAAKAIQAIPTANQRYAEDNAKDAQLTQAYADGKIDPNRVLKNASVGTKIKNGLALILGGIGGSLTGQANPVLGMMKDAIDQDIEAQKNDQSKSMNLWKMNREATGSKIEADLKTQNQLYAVAKAQALQAQAKAQGPEAKARLAGTIQQIDQQMQKNNWVSSRLHGAPDGTETQHLNEMETMRYVDPGMRKEMEAKYIPGVGVAKIPLSAPQRDEITNYDSIGKRLNEAINFQTLDAGSLGTIPGSSMDAKASNIRNSLAAELNKLYHLNRLTEIEYHNFLSQIPNPGSIRTGASLTKLKDLQGQLTDRKDTVLKNLGVTPFKTAGNDQQALAWAHANPRDPRAQKIIQVASAGVH